MVEDDGAEVSAVVVGDEVLGGVGSLEAACPDALVLKEGLVQRKQHLGDGQVEEGRDQWEPWTAQYVALDEVALWLSGRAV